MCPTGYRHSPEAREKIRQAKLGKPRRFSKTPAKTRKLFSAIKKAQQSGGNGFFRGHRHTPETRARMSASIKAAWERRKAAGLPVGRPKKVRPVEPQPLWKNGKLTSAGKTEEVWTELLKLAAN